MKLGAHKHHTDSQTVKVTYIEFNLEEKLTASKFRELFKRGLDGINHTLSVSALGICHSTIYGYG